MLSIIKNWSKIDPDTSCKKIQNITLPARNHLVSKNPYIFADGAHNDHSAQLSRSINDLFLKLEDLIIILAAILDINHRYNRNILRITAQKL